VLSTTAFGLGAKYFAFYEIEGVGVQWNNMAVSPVEDDEYNLQLILLMMVFDALLYGLLTWYIEHVHPGRPPPHLTSTRVDASTELCYCID